MEMRKIIKINEKKCNGCGLCIPNCPEGAIQIIDKKARLISDLFCDGLGACLGHCPNGAITIEEREAEEYSEAKVMENIVKQGKNTIIAHLKHLKEHNQEQYLQQALDFLREKKIDVEFQPHGFAGCPGPRPQLQQWPVQITLVSVTAPYFNNADILIAADCVPFSYASFHEDLLKGRALLVGCPKLDNVLAYKDKIAQILKNNHIKSITYAHMEVPCCFGLVTVIEDAITISGKKIPFKEAIIGIKGERIK